MLINIKYHIITIIALFITLGLGILIGSTIIGSEPIIEQQQSLINDLQNDFRILKKKNKQFEAKVNQLEAKLAVALKLEEKFLPLIREKVLAEEKLLINSGKDVTPQQENRIINFLKLAGAQSIIKFEKNKVKERQYSKVILIGEQSDFLKNKCSTWGTEIIEIEANDVDSIKGLIDFLIKITKGELEQ
ncbi:MAG: copper transporter [Bacillota bacterium]